MRTTTIQLLIALAIADAAYAEDRIIHLDCQTESTPEYAGVAFRYTINEKARTLRASRWSEPVDVVFGPNYITYRTTGMALKMSVSIDRADWRFTMIHEGGVFLVNGGCKESPPG